MEFNHGCQAFHDTQIDVSSDEEPLVRPNMGRDVMARIEAGSHCSSVPATCGHSAQECADTIVDDLERDLTESQAQHAMPSVRAVPSTAVANRFSSLATESDDEQDLEDAIPPTVPASDFAVRQMLSREIHMVGIDSRFIPWLHADSALCVTGSPSGDGPQVVAPMQHDSVDVADVSRQAAPSPAFARGARASNRFFSLATESEDEQTPAHMRCSDTESIPERMIRRRRLRLRWGAEAGPETAPVTQVDPGDSHDHRLARVRHAMQHERRLDARHRQIRDAENFIRDVSRRVGPIDVADGVPRVLRRQQWSPFYVPLMWAAAEGDRQCALLEWMISLARTLPLLDINGQVITSEEALTVGWEVLHNAMRSWGVNSREDLSEWIHNQGYPRPRWGAHFSGRVQERIMNMAIARDVRGVGLESVFVQLIMSSCPEGLSHDDVAPRVVAAGRDAAVASVVEWEVLDEVSLQQVFQKRFSVLQSCPVQVKGRFRQAVRVALEALETAAHGNDEVMECRAWKLFLLLPFMLLRRPLGRGRIGKSELTRRFDSSGAGRWDELLKEAEAETCHSGMAQSSPRDDSGAESKDGVPENPIGGSLQSKTVFDRSCTGPGYGRDFPKPSEQAPSRSSATTVTRSVGVHAGPTCQIGQNSFSGELEECTARVISGSRGCTYEHWKVLLDETDTAELMFAACSRLAQAKVPDQVATALMGARLVAVAKPDGGVRGIATGCTFRRLVARTLAKQFVKVFEAECSPFQYALSTRAGTDCVGHMLRAATDSDPSMKILSVDGIGAYDHIFRSAMLGRLLEMPGARELLPFVRLSYAQPSCYGWHDQEGRRRTVTQAEGGEQGDPLMPLLFSIGIQGALEEVARSLERGEQFCAFLDDVYLLCQPSRVKTLFTVLSDALLRHAGIHLHQGKTKTWNSAGVIPDNVEDVGPEVWQPEGITVLGTPIGSEQFVSRKMAERIEKERQLWRAIPTVPDLQCAWTLLLQSAHPKGNHSMRTMPPTQSATYCVAHDDGIWETAKALLNGVPSDAEPEAKQLSSLTMRLGGLGLQSAERCAPAAYWASWADAIQMIGSPGSSPAGAEDGTTGTFAWVICRRPRHFWTSKGSGGAQVGRHCTMASDHQNKKSAIQASGHTVGSIGLPPSLTLNSGGRSCCLAALPLAKLTSALTPDATQERLCRMLPQLLSSQSRHICSGCSCWNGSDFRCH